MHTSSFLLLLVTFFQIPAVCVRPHTRATLTAISGRLDSGPLRGRDTKGLCLLASTPLIRTRSALVCARRRTWAWETYSCASVVQHMHKGGTCCVTGDDCTSTLDIHTIAIAPATGPLVSNSSFQHFLQTA